MKQGIDISKFAFFKLIQFFKKVDIINDCKYYDYLTAFHDNATKYAFKVFSSDIDEAEINTNFLMDLKSGVKGKDSRLQLSLYILRVDPETGKAWFQVILDREIPESYIESDDEHNLLEESVKIHPINEERWQEFTKNNVEKVFDISRNTIALLPQKLLGVKKSITFEVNDAKYQAVYFRSFTDSYKMKPVGQLTFLESFNRDLYGTPQNEYPDDILDKLIRNAIKGSYTVKTTTSSLFLFNTDLRDLQSSSQYAITECGIKILLEQEEIIEVLKKSLNAIVNVDFPITVVPCNILDKDRLDATFVAVCSSSEIKQVDCLKDTYMPLSEMLY